MNATRTSRQSPLIAGALHHLTQYLRTRHTQSAYLALMLLDCLSHEPGVSDELRAQSSRLADAIDALCRGTGRVSTLPTNAWEVSHVSH